MSVREGSIHALIGGSGAGKSAVVGCVLGRCQPSLGRVLVLGQDARRHRRRLRQSIQAITAETSVRPSLAVEQLARGSRSRAVNGDELRLRERLARLNVPLDQPFGTLSPSHRTAALLAVSLATGPRLLVLDGVDLGVGSPEHRVILQELRNATSRSTSVLIATRKPEDVAEIADAVSFLREGRLVLDEEMVPLKSRFRRIRYRNEIVPARIEYGNELDDFDAVRVRVRGWGVDAIVSNFDEARFDRFRQIPGVVDIETSEMSLGEIFTAVTGKEGQKA